MSLLERLRWPRPRFTPCRPEATCAYFGAALGEGDWQGSVLASASRAVIVRYLDAAVRRRLARAVRGAQRLVYFMDDDLLDARVLSGLPAAYADRLWALAGAHKRWLLAHCDEFWVSTPALAHKYAALRPRLVALAPTPELTRGAQDGSLRVAYHGSAAHHAELQWLRPILSRVLHEATNTHLELVGDHRVNRLFRELPRTTVLHPMGWSNYLAHTRSARVDIGLAPLVAGGGFNAGRGPVKFFDYARMGGLTIASRGPVFEGHIEHERSGLLLADEPALWIETLLALAREPAHVQRLAAAAQQRALRWAAPASAERRP